MRATAAQSRLCRGGRGRTPSCTWMYKLRVEQRVAVRDNSEWAFVEAAHVGRCGTVVAFTAGAFHATNECYDVVLDGDARVACFCFRDLRTL